MAAGLPLRHGRATRIPPPDRPYDNGFCERVSEALADGYTLYGSPAVTFDGQRLIVAQAVVLRRGFDTKVVPA